MSTTAAPPRRIVPETVQSSGMDCGPAALRSLLAGFDVPVSYGRLREACQTDVDGTSIDALEAVARALGLDVAQLMLPADHVALPCAAAMPAIAVSVLASGMPHFVVAWRRHGRFVQVMDPATGRRIVGARTLPEMLYIHEQAVPFAAWEGFAEAPVFQDALRERLGELGVRREAAGELVAAAQASGGRAMAALDAQTRALARPRERRARATGAVHGASTSHGDGPAPRPPAAEPGRADDGAHASHSDGVAPRSPAEAHGRADDGAHASHSDGVAPRSPAEAHGRADDGANVSDGDSPAPRSAAEVLREAVADPDGALATLPPEAWFARPATAGPDPAEVMLRGAVLVRARGRVEEPPDLASLPPDLAAALTEPPPRPAQRLLDAARAAGRVALGPLAAGTALLAAGVVAETALLRGSLDALDVRRTLLIVAAIAIALAIVETLAARGGLGIGRRLEIGLRRALAATLPRLPDRYLRSRPPSDMAQRAHALHELRMLPLLATQLLGATLETVFVAGALCVLDPAGAPFVVLATIGVLGVALAVQLPLRERELRAHEHASAIGQTTLDAVLGVLPIRAHGAEDALIAEHDARLRGWIGAARAAVRARTAATLVQTACGIGLAIPLVVAGVDHLDSPPERLLLVLWAITIPFTAERVAQIALQWPQLRTLAIRLAEPLDAPLAQPAAAPPPAEGAALGPDRPPLTAAPPPAAGAALGPDRPPLTAAPPPAAAAARAGAEVVFEGATVRATGQDVLAPTTLRIAPGEHVALVGLSGAGKSTLLALALGLADPSEGSVAIDGADPRASWPVVAWVDPQVRVWNRGLAENVAPLADTARVSALVESAELGAVAARVGDEALGADGGLLSGGEAQRVRLARALDRDAVRLAVLDEPLRGLDREQRHRLLAVARERWRDATLLCATHDVEDVRSFHRVLVLDGGRVVADGPPAELLARDGSPLRAMLDTERELRAELDAGRGWRRLRVASGTLAEEERTGAGSPPPACVAEAAPVPAAGAAAAQAPADGATAAEVPPAAGAAAAQAPADVATAAEVPPAAGAAAAQAPADGATAAELSPAASTPAAAEAAPAPRAPAAAEAAPAAGAPAAAAAVCGAAGPTGGRARVALAVFAGATLLRYVAFAASWSVIGSAILDGDDAALTTWALLLAATVPLGALAEAAEGRTAIALGARLRERTLRGALALDASWVRREGPGRILGRSMEVDAIARLAAGGGLTAITAAIELGVGATALLLSPAGGPAAAAIGAVLAIAAVVTATAVRRRRVWATARLAETDELLEAIAGQRTRLIQGDHDEQARARRLDAYERLGGAADRPFAILAGTLPRAGLAAGLAALALGGDLSSSADVALALGGVLLASQALRRMAAAVEALTSASIARRALEPILEAAKPRGASKLGTEAPQDRAPTGAARPAGAPASPAGAGPHATSPGPATLAVRGLRVARGGREVLRDVDLELRPGDRAVLCGPSGAGKSTLAAAIAGLLPAADGDIALGDARPRDRGWRDRVGFVPQHGDNHILLAPLAFNLLMGRNWPPTERDLADAAAVCRELGLGPLLERMPAGIGQVVGETGWRLSQGERARVCLARALLADHDVLLLDEPLGALDPHTARTILDVVRRRARTLVVISQE